MEDFKTLTHAPSKQYTVSFSTRGRLDASRLEVAGRAHRAA